MVKDTKSVMSLKILVLVSLMFVISGIFDVRIGNTESAPDKKETGSKMIDGQYGAMFQMLTDMLASAGNKKKGKNYSRRIDDALSKLKIHDKDYEEALDSEVELKIWADFKGKRDQAEKQIIQVKDLLLACKLKQARKLLYTDVYKAMEDAQSAVDVLNLWFQ